MNLPDELKFLEKPLNYLLYKPSSYGIIRIFTWCISFLVLFNLLAPQVPAKLLHQKAMDDQNLISMSSTGSDPRWSRGQPAKFGNNSIDIAWVAGSSILLPHSQDGDWDNKTYHHIPGRIQDILLEKFDTQTQSYVYMMLARRVLDTYTMTLDAIERSPDALIVIFNPFWIINDHALFYKDNLANRGAALWGNSTDWFYAISLSSPGNILWAYIGRHIPLIENGADYLKAFRELIQTTVGIDVKKLKKGKKKKLLADLTYDPPLTFWLVNRIHKNEKHVMEKGTGKLNVSAWQDRVMALNGSLEHTLSHQITTRLLDKIKASKIPALVYLAPLSSDIAEPNAVAGYTYVYKEMNKLKKQYEADNLKFITDFPRDIDISLTHADHLHLQHPGKLPAFLATEIFAMLPKRESP